MVHPARSPDGAMRGPRGGRGWGAWSRPARRSRPATGPPAVPARPRPGLERADVGRRRARAGRRRPPGPHGGPAGPRPIVQAGRPLRRPDRRRRPGDADRAARASTGRSSPGSPGAATSPWSSRPRRPDLVRGVACVDGGWLEPSRDFADWEACRAALRRPGWPGAGSTRSRATCARPTRTGPRPASAACSPTSRSGRTAPIAPWLTFDRHIEVLRGLWEHHPSELYAGIAVPVLLAPADGGDGDRDAAQAPGRGRGRGDHPERPGALVRGRPRHPCPAPGRTGGRDARLTADGFFA